MAALSRIKDPSYGMVYVTNNELGTEKTLKTYKQIPHRPGTNAIWGCGGTFILDLTSISPKPIQYLTVFDLSSKVATFWKQMQSLIPMLDPENLKVSQFQFIKFVKDYYGNDHYGLLLEKIRVKESFLSTKKQLIKIVTLFNEKKFTFHPLDLLNPKQFRAFIEHEQEKGAIPFAIYISNISRCINCDVSSNKQITMRDIRNMVYSFDLFPRDAIIIDASDGVVPTSQIHPNTPIALRTLLPGPLEQIFPYALFEDDGEYIKLLVKHGVNPNSCSLEEEGITYLMVASTQEKSNAILALLDSKADVNSGGGDNETPLMCAALRDSPETIKLLVSYGANLEAKTFYKKTALHGAAAKGNVRALKTLLELKANPNSKEIRGHTPIDYLTIESYRHLAVRKKPKVIQAEIIPLLTMALAKTLDPPHLVSFSTIKPTSLTTVASVGGSSEERPKKENSRMEKAVVDSLLALKANPDPSPKQQLEMPLLIDEASVHLDKEA